MNEENDMGVYIPNMEKPKECKECQWHLDFYIEDEQVGGLCTITEKDDRENDCPLIDIVTCGECKYYEESEYIRGDMVCKYHMGHTYYTEADRFCSHGERRSDEHNTERD